MLQMRKILLQQKMKTSKHLALMSWSGLNADTANTIELYIKLMKGKALRKHSLHEKTAASVLLKLFISGIEWCHTTDAP